MALSMTFRLRLFISAALIVAAVLAMVLALGWGSVRRYEVERLDERLCMEARRLATQAPQQLRGDDMPRLEADVAAKLHLQSAAQLMLSFQPQANQTALLSSHWRDDLAWSALHWTPHSAGQGRGLPPPPPRQHSDERPPDRDDRGEADTAPAAPDGQPREQQQQQQRLPPPPRALGQCSLAAFSTSAADWRAARFSLPRRQAWVAADLGVIQADMQAAVQRALLLVVPLALLLTALGAWLLAGLMLRPVRRLSEAMKRVTQQALDQRLPSAGEDREFKGLIAAYNTMLARLESSFHQATRFSADAAHELKTPLTILQGRIERAVQASENRGIQADLTDMLDEVGRLANITRKLLLLSQADAGGLALHIVPVNLSELLGALAADAQMLLDEPQRLSCDIAPDLAAQGDALLLRQLFNNLISNALRYVKPPDGWIRLSGRHLPGGVEVVFANASEPLAAAARARFFDRFYRGSQAQQQRADGNGLGLSLAREIARAHSGELTLERSALDEVWLRLWLPDRKT
jgi:two-component system heavy metal sensor histidine kinase CusS